MATRVPRDQHREHRACHVPIDRDGAWLVRTVHMIAGAQARVLGVEWDSYWATLAFHTAPPLLWMGARRKRHGRGTDPGPAAAKKS